MRKEQVSNPSSIAVSSTERLLPSGATTSAQGGYDLKKIEFRIPGKVIGKGRPHFVKKTGVAITPQQTRGYESLIRDVALPLMGGHQPWEGCVRVCITAKYKIPKSWSKKDRQLAIDGKVPPKKPDVDNVVKIVLDALNRVVYLDDTQVTQCTVRKMWDEDEDSLAVYMEELE
jgi:Holliday junction resolvase RusA-like endonuclease